jgi:acyl-CoA thioesterase-1
MRLRLALLALAALAVPAALAFPTGASADTVRIVALGDSNTAGLFAGRRNAFPALIEQSLRGAGYDVQITNRGISGDTTGGMLGRLDSAVPRGTGIAIVQGGYNDGRKGVPAAQRDANVDAILKRLAARGVKTILCGLDGASWSGIASRNGATLVPGSTCYDAASVGFDRLHMNRAGHRVVAARLAPVVQRLLGRP